ncbi:MAG: hypothetical protein ACYTG0_43895 [Planctomycetota bacterium]
MRDAVAVMITLTTYGTWLRREEHQWVDEDIILPAEPIRRAAERHNAQHPTLLFSRDQIPFVGTQIGNSLRGQMGLRIWALTVQTWYAHLVVARSTDSVRQILLCAERAVREGLGLKRPVWGGKYDKRFCFDDKTLRHWIDYVERNNVLAGMPERPWPFLESPGA